MAFYTTYRSWPSDIASYASTFPFLVTLLDAARLKIFSLRFTDFIVSHHDAAAMAAILSIEEINCMKSCTRACKEIYNKGVRIIGSK